MSASRKYDQETRDRALLMYQDRFAEGGISQLSLDPPEFLSGFGG